MKRSVWAFFVVIICICLFSFFASAADASVRVIPNISSFEAKNNTSLVLNDFSETNEGWNCVDGNGYITLAEQIDAFPYLPLMGDGCLIVRNDNAKSGASAVISKKYDGFDLSSYNNLFFGVNCIDIVNGNYSVEVRIYSENDVLVGEAEIDSSCWNGVLVDISAFESRDSVKEIRLSVNVDSDIDENFFEYYIDYIALTDDDNLYNSIKYSSDRYASNGIIEYGDEYMNVSISGNVLELESEGFGYKSIGEANCLKVKFNADGFFEGVRLYVMKEDGEFYEESYTEAELNSEEGIIYLPIHSDNISEIRMVFEGIRFRNITIHYIQISSMYVSSQNDAGNIDTCVINPVTEEVIVRGNIDKTVSENYLKEELFLFANDLCDSVNEDILDSSQSIARGSVSSDSFVFRFPYDKNDSRKYLYKKYTVAIKTNGSYIILGGSMCITNPEVFNTDVAPSKYSGSGKGIYGESISFMQSVGATDTAVWVDIGKFFLQENETGSKFSCGGIDYYYNTQYAKELNSIIENYAEKNIAVTLIVTVSDTGNETLNKLLIHKDSNTAADYCAYNTTDKAGIGYLRAFCEYFADKYCKNSLDIKRFVFGDSVGNAYTNYNMGNQVLEEFSKQYSAALRILYNAVKSYSPYAEVYTYIDCNWDKDIPFDVYTRYDNKEFIYAVNRAIFDNGNIDWGIAQNPYPENVENYLSYSNAELEEGVNADVISFKKLHILTDYFKRGELLYNNSQRNIIIIEKTMFSDINEDIVTADYVFNCYKAMNCSVSAYITDRNCNYNGAMKYVDTSLSFMSGHFVQDILGLATWESVIEGFSEDNILRKIITQSDILYTSPNYKGSMVLSDFSNSNDGWSRYGFSEEIIGGSELSERENLLSVKLGNIPEGESRGIVRHFDSAKDFSASPILKFDVNIASLPADVDSSLLTVIMISGNNVYEVSGMIKETTWTEVYCDFSKFDGIDRVDYIYILFTADAVEYYDSPQVLLSSVEAVSLEYDSDYLQSVNDQKISNVLLIEKVKKYVIPIAFCVLAVAVVVFLYRRTYTKTRYGK